MVNERQRKTAYNTGFASGGAIYVLETFCISKKLVTLDSFVLFNPPERKALSVGCKCRERHCKTITNKNKLSLQQPKTIQ